MKIKRGKVYRFAYPVEFTTLPDYSQHRGNLVTVLRQLSNKECDPECQPMYQVRAADGWQGHASGADELKPHGVAKICYWLTGIDNPDDPKSSIGYMLDMHDENAELVRPLRFDEPETGYTKRRTYAGALKAARARVRKLAKLYGVPVREITHDDDSECEHRGCYSTRDKTVPDKLR